MIEIVKKIVLVANRELKASSMNVYGDAYVSAVDRLTNNAVFKTKGPDLNEDSFLVVSLENGAIISGLGKAPADMTLQLALFKQFPQINAIVHVYPKYTSLLSQAKIDIPVASRIHAMYFKNTIHCLSTDQEDFSLTDAYPEHIVQTALNLLNKNEVYSVGALLLACDGALVWDETPLKATNYAEHLEKIAELSWNSKLLSTRESIISPFLAAKLFDQKQAELSYGEPSGLPGTEVTARQKKAVNLALLAYFDKTCRKNGIKYSLTGGTLIGAVRHGGMIPWDDDVDVFLTRPEYEKLRTVFPEGGRYEFVTMQKDPSFNYVFGRLIDNYTLVEYSQETAGTGRGLCLDICIVDGLPDNEKKRKRHMRYMRLLVRFRRATIQNPNSKTYKSKGFLHFLAKRILCKLTDIHFWNRRIAKAMNRYSFSGGKYVGNFTSQYGNRELLHASVFDDYFDVRFENLTCMVCAGFDEYLTNIYKDYLKFPPISKRKAPHIGKVIWVAPSNQIKEIQEPES